MSKCPRSPSSDPVPGVFIPRLPALVGLVGLACSGVGCVHVYQPISGLNRPVVVDPTRPNFEGLSLTAHCIPGEYLDRPENRMLCRRVGELFENQGAKVTVVDTVGITEDPFADSAFAPEPQGQAADPLVEVVPSDLVLEIRSSQSARENRTLSWAACIASFSLVPAVDDRTFVLDVTVRDGEGFLLSRQMLKGRTIVRWGAGVYLGNRVMDWLVRDPEDRVFGGRADREVSRDVYAQLSQILFNAKMRARVLTESAAETSP